MVKNRKRKGGRIKGGKRGWLGSGGWAGKMDTTVLEQQLNLKKKRRIDKFVQV